jgi:hypothetical protein
MRKPDNTRQPPPIRHCKRCRRSARASTWKLSWNGVPGPLGSGASRFRSLRLSSSSPPASLPRCAAPGWTRPCSLPRSLRQPPPKSSPWWTTRSSTRHRRRRQPADQGYPYPACGKARLGEPRSGEVSRGVGEPRETRRSAVGARRCSRLVHGFGWWCLPGRLDQLEENLAEGPELLLVPASVLLEVAASRAWRGWEVRWRRCLQEDVEGQADGGLVGFGCCGIEILGPVLAASHRKSVRQLARQRRDTCLSRPRRERSARGCGCLRSLRGPGGLRPLVKA